jgi:hypothetical protein
MFSTMFALAITCGIVASAVAQESAPAAHIAYRLTETKTQHFDDAQKAQQHLDALKKLGCEVSQSGYEGHGDLAYRCTKWRVLPLAKEELAHQWETWLRESGFETLHGHTEEHGHEHEHEHAADKTHDHSQDAEHHEEVSYRLSTSLTLHPQQDADAQELIAIVKGLGCEIREGRHEGHRDLSISCPEWKHVDFPTHEVAQAWEQWLTKNGFETRHAH